ncbi:hypothetical protein [Stakelama tenebrarum]|uniref:Spore coat protein U domain-containing protein n=1 Tax=Stakelama tenebrarum TaxID=2711215 RepID=A0A6G6Y2A8_9SPHN|nr:hypothetical protein [Sphingosinithalassobacter tenebrarum]QIG79040.1 hypothetical protein G5C33_04075 [Sphingosinithalassobacter tenebrarum]
MKRIAYVAAALAPCCFALPAQAQDASVAIRGTLAEECTIKTPEAAAIDPASAAPQSIGTASVVCNFVGAPTMRVWSLNGGQIVSPASEENGQTEQAQPYSFAFDGVSLGKLGKDQEGASYVPLAVTASNTAHTADAQITIATPATVAGTYSDIIYVSINP